MEQGFTKEQRATRARGEREGSQLMAAQLRASIFIYLPWDPLPALHKGVVAPIYMGGENLCNLSAAEVCSAEATELPVWKRPPVSVANGLCHPWTQAPCLPAFSLLDRFALFTYIILHGLVSSPTRRET